MVNTKEKSTYIGYICNMLRDTKILSPKILLQDVVYETGKEFRDHVWVDYNNKLRKLRPKTTKKRVKITFKAYEKEYPSTDGGTKLGLVHLSHITEIEE